MLSKEILTKHYYIILLFLLKLVSFFFLFALSRFTLDYTGLQDSKRHFFVLLSFVPFYLSYIDHCYTNDTQIYLPVTVDSMCSLKNLFNCLDDIKCWMVRNFLQLNENITEVIIFGPLTLSLALAAQYVNLHNEVKNLGVFLNIAWNFNMELEL